MIVGPFAILVAGAIAAPILAHLAGWLTWRSVRVVPGSVRYAMPHAVDAEERGFDRRVRNVLRSILAASPGTLEAATIAASAGEPIEIVEMALARMRALAPCRLRVTASGRLLHDFDAAAITRLRALERSSRLRRIFAFAALLLANVGAAFTDEVNTGDPAVDDAVLHVFGDVGGAHEQNLDGRVPAGEGERPIAGLLGAEPRVDEQVERGLAQPALHGHGDPQDAGRSRASR